MPAGQTIVGYFKGFSRFVHRPELVEAVVNSVREYNVTLVTGPMAAGKSSIVFASIERHPEVFKKVCIGTALRRHRDTIYRILNRGDKVLLESRVEVCPHRVCKGDIIWDTAACASCPTRGECPFYSRLSNTVRRDSFTIVTTHDIVSVVYPYSQVVILDEVDVGIRRLRLYSRRYVDFVLKAFPESERKVESLLKRLFTETPIYVKEGGSWEKETVYVGRAHDISERVEKRRHVLITATLPTLNYDDPVVRRALDLGVDEDDLEWCLRAVCLGLVRLFYSVPIILDKVNIIHLRNLLKNDVLIVNRHKVYVSEGRAVKTALKYTENLASYFAERGLTVGIVAPNKTIGREIEARIPWARVIVVCGKESRGVNIDVDAIIAWYQYPRPETIVSDGFLRLVLNTFQSFLLPYAASEYNVDSRVFDILFKVLVAAENVQTLFRFIRRWRGGRRHIVVMLDYRMYEAMKWFTSTMEYIRDNKSRTSIVSGLTEVYKTVRKWV